jgi:hypothetical protein
VNVIPFKRAGYTAYFFTEGGVNVVRKWFWDQENPDVEWAAFQMMLDIYESGGIESIAASTVDFENGFYGLKVVRRGGVLPCPILTLGPFDEATEITFLVGARWDDVKKRVRPYGSIGTAEENLEVLRENPGRRRRGSGT